MPNILQRAIQGIPNAGLERAKKLADLAIKKRTNIDSSGNPTTRGYEEAVAYLQEFAYSKNEKEALDAQRLIAGYENNWTKLKKKEIEGKTTTAGFKLEEQGIYWMSPQDADEKLLRDPLEIVRFTADGLSRLEIKVQNAIDIQESYGEDATESKKYLLDLSERAESMRRLQKDILNREVSQKDILKGYGFFIDADQNDGFINRVAVLPTSNLPNEVAQDFRQIDSYADIDGGYLPVQSRVPKERDISGNYVTRIGGAIWSAADTSMPLKQSGKSTVGFDKPGDFSINDKRFSMAGVDVRPDTYAKGYTGIDADGNLVESYFYADKDGNLFSLDKDQKELYSKDPKQSSAMKNARPLGYAQAIRFASSPDVKPITSVPTETIAPTMQPQQTEASQPTTFFQDKDLLLHRNVPNKPEEPTIGTSTPDIVEQGKGFFRKVAGFFGGQ